jgi:hypothetical protein
MIRKDFHSIFCKICSKNILPKKLFTKHGLGEKVYLLREEKLYCVKTTIFFSDIWNGTHIKNKNFWYY